MSKERLVKFEVLSFGKQFYKRLVLLANGRLLLVIDRSGLGHYSASLGASPALTLWQSASGRESTGGLRFDYPNRSELEV